MFTVPGSSVVQKKFSERISDYVWEKQTSGKWRKEAEYRDYTLYRAVQFFGDVDVAAITRDGAREFTKFLSVVPPNYTKNRSFAGMSIIDAALKNTYGPKLSPKSINLNLEAVSSFFKWCVRCGYADRNPFEALSVKVTTPALMQRLPFTTSELKQLFAHKIFNGDECRASEFFLPLLGLYHGARLNELCQLHVSDIYQNEDGTWVMDINDKDPLKTLKNAHSARVLPIHPELIRLNFIKFVQRLGAGRVFSNLTYKRGKFSGDYSKRFRTLRKRQGVTKVFHSFRHLVANDLKKLKIQEYMVASILGHLHPNITFSRYGEPEHVAELHEILPRLSYDIDVQPWPEELINKELILRKIEESVPGLNFSMKQLATMPDFHQRVKRRI